MTDATARAMVWAETRGLGTHGLSRLPQYIAHLGNRRAVDPAVPQIVREKGGAVPVDAGSGLAFAACVLAVREATARARANGVAFAGVTNSHHYFGAAAWHLDPVGEAGLVGLAFGNPPSAMPAWGGKRALFGTNPIAAVFPRRGNPPISIDLSLSEVGRGKLMMAAREGKPIPEGWALDKDGRPTTDPEAGLDGVMLLVTALTGAQIGFEASSFFVDEGNRPRLGLAFLVIDPGALAGADTYAAQVEDLLARMLQDGGVRVPGSRRLDLARAADRAGIEFPETVLK